MTDETRNYNQLVEDNARLRDSINELLIKLHDERTINSALNKRIAELENKLQSATYPSR